METSNQQSSIKLLELFGQRYALPLTMSYISKLFVLVDLQMCFDRQRHVCYSKQECLVELMVLAFTTVTFSNLQVSSNLR